MHISHQIYDTDNYSMKWSLISNKGFVVLTIKVWTAKLGSTEFDLVSECFMQAARGILFNAVTLLSIWCHEIHIKDYKTRTYVCISVWNRIHILSLTFTYAWMLAFKFIIELHGFQASWWFVTFILTNREKFNVFFNCSP